MKTLHARLVIVLLALIIPLSVLFVVATLLTSRRYYQEITQELNVGLAASILADTPDLMIGDEVDTDKFDQLASNLAMTNPGVEIYILGSDGYIIGSSIAMNDLERSTVDLEAVRHFLAPGTNYPLLGTDPRRESGGKIFSVTPLSDGMGYVYVLLADQIGDSVIRTVQNSTVLRLGMYGGLAVIALVLGVGAVAFNLLTRRLRRLETAMTDFRQHDFVASEAVLPRIVKPQDEIDELQNVFSDMAARISEQMQDLRQVDTLRRELITNVSHDLRTPLAALRGYLETLQYKDLSDDDKKKYLAAAQKHSERLGRLITDLFDLSRLDAGAMQARLEPFPLQELAQDVIVKFEGTAATKGVTLTLAVAEGLPFVNADIGLVERALTNLIDNALRYTPAGGEVRLELGQQQEAVTVTVADTGQGIAEADLPFIFDRFYRASKHEGAEGSGLGLAITKRIVALHNSDITVESSKQGATFRFALPFAL